MVVDEMVVGIQKVDVPRLSFTRSHPEYLYWNKLANRKRSKGSVNDKVTYPLRLGYSTLEGDIINNITKVLRG